MPYDTYGTVVYVTGYPQAEIDYPETIAVTVTPELPQTYGVWGWRVAVTAHKPAEIELVPALLVAVSANLPILAGVEHPVAALVEVLGHVPPVLTVLNPVRFLPSYAFDGANLSFDIADLVAPRTSGSFNTDVDWRRISQGLMLRVDEYITGLNFSQRKNIWPVLTHNYTYEHATLDNVWRQTLAIQIAREFLNAYIKGQP